MRVAARSQALHRCRYSMVRAPCGPTIGASSSCSQTRPGALARRSGRCGAVPILCPRDCVLAAAVERDSETRWGQCPHSLGKTAAHGLPLSSSRADLAAEGSVGGHRRATCGSRTLRTSGHHFLGLPPGKHSFAWRPITMQFRSRVPLQRSYFHDGCCIPSRS